MIKKLNVNFIFIIGLIMVLLLFVFALLGPFISPHDIKDQMNILHYGKDKLAFSPFKPFTFNKYLFGTDKWGYDLLTLLMYGARWTIFTAIAISFIKLLLGLVVGLYNGTRKKSFFIWNSLENSLSYVPSFLVIYFILLPISFNTNLKPINHVIIFVIVTSIIGFPSIAATMKEKTKQLYQSTFIEAAIASGTSKSKIIMFHLIPHLKQDIIVLFVLEIVSAITIIGQLALFHIFLGGTLVEYDPILYHSITKEWAGLIGQARENLWVNQYLLFIPLAFLLYATIAFHLLAVGTKRKYEKSYNKGSWLK